MNSITIGQYIPGDSWLHRLDPRLKILLTITWIVLIFLIPNIYGMIGALVLYFVMFFTTGLPFRRVLKGFKPVVFLLTFTFVLQLIYITEGNLLYTVNFQFGLYHLLMILGISIFYFLTKKYVPLKLSYFFLFVIGIFGIQLLKFDSFIFGEYSLKIYDAGLTKGFYIFIRILLMIGITSLLTFSTMSIDINNGLQSLLSPLSYLKIPVGVFSTMISLTLRFIPLIFDETNKIMKAQASRGVEFSEGNLKAKVTQIISLIIPMFVISFSKAEDLANAMEVRGYIIDGKRTRLDELSFKLRDYIALFVTIAATVGLVIWNVL